MCLSSYISKQKHPKYLMEIQLKTGTGCRNLKNRDDFTLRQTVFYRCYFACFSSLKIFSFQLTINFRNFASLFFISIFLLCFLLLCLDPIIFMENTSAKPSKVICSIRLQFSLTFQSLGLNTINVNVKKP